MNIHKETWRKIKLGEVSQIIMGQSPPSSTYNTISDGLPFFQGITEFTDRYPVPKKWCSKPLKIAKPGDILITVRAPVGATNIANQKCCIGRGIAAIRSQENIDFMLSCLRFSEKELSKKGSGTIFGGISAKILNELIIPLPSQSEQHIIAELFQRLDQSIIVFEEQKRNLIALQRTISNKLTSTQPTFGNFLTDHTLSLCSMRDILDCIEEHNKNPIENGLTKFVGLQNIEPENFKLQGFGNLEDGTTFTKYFKKGDVLFGKRRAYLKKVAIADFDGICSGDILVFRAINTKILPELLPYYVASDPFLNLAISTSAGSLSPRTKWKDLEKFQLSLPDLETQEKIMHVFNQINQSQKYINQQIETLKNLKLKLLREIFG